MVVEVLDDWRLTLSIKATTTGLRNGSDGGGSATQVRLGIVVASHPALRRRLWAVRPDGAVHFASRPCWGISICLTTECSGCEDSGAAWSRRSASRHRVRRRELRTGGRAVVVSIGCCRVYPPEPGSCCRASLGPSGSETRTHTSNTAIHTTRISILAGGGACPADDFPGRFAIGDTASWRATGIAFSGDTTPALFPPKAPAPVFSLSPDALLPTRWLFHDPRSDGSVRPFASL